MTQVYDNSVVSSGLDRVLIEEGRIINVNMRRWTADVKTETNQSNFLDIQWGNAYLHFANGEGIYAMPEVGAKCMVCRPSDSPPFIMCFTTTFEREGVQDGENQGERDVQEGQEAANSNITFASGRPHLQQGDIMLRGRDGNQIWLRRGGVVEIGSTAISKRLYIPLLNYIRDFCENYSLMTFGGDLSWVVNRVDDAPDGEAKALLKILAKEAAQHEHATVAIQVGQVDDDNRVSITVAPNAIDMETAIADGGPLFELLIDKEGSVEITSKKDATITIEGELELTVEGGATYDYQSGVTTSVSGNHETSVSGSHKLTANSSEERMSGSKTITSSAIRLGGTGASKGVALGPPLMGWLSGLSTTLMSAGISVGQPPASIISRKVMAE